jgi:hypothetical protein
MSELWKGHAKGLKPAVESGDFEELCAALERAGIRYVDYASSYGEPGYTDPEKAILFADWNPMHREIGDYLERAGYALEWSDEWIVCSETGKAYRTQPDSYSWTPYYHLTEDGDVIGGDEIENDESVAREYLDLIENDPRKANLFDLDFESLGYRRLNEADFEAGFYPGQNDNPRKILADLQAKDPDGQFVFSVTGKGQFDVHFAVYRKEG